MEQTLTGRRALVGGSTKGLGFAVAMALAHRGAAVMLMARDEARLQMAIDALPSPQGQQHSYLVADFSNLDAFRRQVGAALAEGRIDILVNNTQGPKPASALEAIGPDYQEAFDLLFQTTVYTTQQVLPGMQARGFGRIIQLASVTVQEPLPHLALSNSMRSALVAWSKTLSRDVAAQGVTVNSILTGYFDTERMQQLFRHQATSAGSSEEAARQQVAQQIPAGRLGHPEELAALVAFLASDAAGYITGAAIPVDGGLLRGI